ncbi:MAG: hypothetical protein EBS01_15115 [Verrucomicrobia bacterium]|nr:hypothetical protein [Verrucomicrobiota bacterium]
MLRNRFPLWRRHQSRCQSYFQRHIGG